eukprot:TRINITY_DN4664_c0_g1_i2.p1 TRINITY_DN4664_c0_g1~~TRINITY_DN4664_c0_g1_i2.p1  ORF type:complete len:200 (+),score=68.80 TRINITY_DN4664_c0_g1_i2:65-664(+)
MCIRDSINAEYMGIYISRISKLRPHTKMHPLLRRLLMSVANIGFKSVINAYRNHVSRRGASAKVESPFTKMFNEMKKANLVTSPMTRTEAIKILHLEAKTEVEPKDVMQSYTKLFAQNDPAKGGSFYIQSKIFYAKEELMKEFPGAEKEFYAQMKAEEEAAKSEQAAPAQENKQEQKSEEKAEKAEKENNESENKKKKD